MPGKRITDHQVHKYKQHRNKLNQVASAAKAGISERNAQLPSSLSNGQPKRGEHIFQQCFSGVRGVVLHKRHHIGCIYQSTLNSSATAPPSACSGRLLAQRNAPPGCAKSSNDPHRCGVACHRSHGHAWRHGYRLGPCCIEDLQAMSEEIE